jgi:hypothetical protein
MSALTMKRLAVVVISQALGFLTALLIITVGFDALPLISSIQTPQGVSIAEYGNIYFLVTFVPIGIIYMIIIDAYVDSKILPD